MEPDVIDKQLHDELAERKEAKALLNDQRRVLELVASGAPLAESLNTLVRLIEEHAPGMLGSILLLDEEGVHLHHGASPSLPLEYSAAIDGVSIGPNVGSCGTAAFCKEAVYVEDIATDPLWSEFKGVALPHGLRACWSTPVFDSQGRVLGTFAMYYRQPGLPQPYHRRLIEITTHITAIAISRHRMEKYMECRCYFSPYSPPSRGE
jgi:GAF domain-containing protein